MKKYFMINYIHSGKHNTLIPLDNIVQIFTFITSEEEDYLLHIVTTDNSIDIPLEEIDCIDIVDLFEV